MTIKAVLLTALAVLTLGACATPIIVLKNDQTHQIARCGGGSTGSMTGGLIGQKIEEDADERCARRYEVQGFHRVE